MNKSPEQYFQEQDFSLAHEDESSHLSPAEQAFLEKYVDANSQSLLHQLDVNTGNNYEKVADQHEVMASAGSIDTFIRNSDELQMVAFYLGAQEFVLPAMVVQEVVRAMPLTKLPLAPKYVSGAISLRGKITPIIMLRELLEANSPRQTEDAFIIVCRRYGLQFGLAIERIHTMYRIDKKNIDWNIETHFGNNVEFVGGLVKLNGRLMGIINVDEIIRSIVE